MKLKRLEVMLEFLIFGIVLGVIEDAIAVKLISGEPITWSVIGIIILITIPFAVLGELVVDNVSIARGMKKMLGQPVESKEIKENKKM
ncbi:MAG: hypothetical protein ACOCVY_00705 [Patescibacteria group bacterium]